MNLTKTTLSTALAAVVGVSGSAAFAATIQTMDITDVDGDGLAGGFAFASGVSVPSKYGFFFDSTTPTLTSTAFGFDMSFNGDGLIQADGLPEGVSSFTAGFIFSTGNLFKPNTLDATGVGGDSNPSPAGGIAGTVNSGDTALTFSEFTWSGQFGTSLFPLSPDAGFTTALAGQGLAGCATGSSQVCYQLRWEHFIAPQGGFEGDTVWQIEGVAILDGAVTLADFPTTGPVVPVPAAVWLFGSGLLGLVGVARRRKA